MLTTIMTALLPIFATIFLGYFAGKHHDFDQKQAGVLNKMVMLYALPLSLFAGTLANDRSVIFQLGWMFVLLTLAFVAGYFIVLYITHKIFKRDIKSAALQALVITCPSVPFVGAPVLSFLYGDVSIIPIALSTLIMNLVQVPVTVYILSSTNDGNTSKSTIINNLKNTIKQPIVWVPVFAFLLLMSGLSIPKNIRSAFLLLGVSSSGVALFSAGILMYSFKVSFNKVIATSVASKNILLPAIIFLIGFILNVDSKILSMTTIVVAIPSATICTILAVQYKTSEKEMTSTLFYSVMFSIISLSAVLMLLN